MDASVQRFCSLADAMCPRSTDLQLSDGLNSLLGFVEQTLRL